MSIFRKVPVRRAIVVGAAIVIGAALNVPTAQATVPTHNLTVWGTPYGTVVDQTDVVHATDTTGLTLEHWSDCDPASVPTVWLGVADGETVVWGDLDGSRRLDTRDECTIAAS